MSTPPLRPSGAAAMTQLPPSPVSSAAAVSSIFHPTILSEFSLDGGSNNNNNSRNNNEHATRPSRRLRSVARYQAFHPQALACSNTLTSSLSDEESTAAVNPNKPTTSSANTANSPAAPRGNSGPSSLGAVAGPQGVALFRLSRPHVPLLILSHATNSTAGLFSSLAFQPTPINNTGTSSNSSMYLAAARGSGVLVWDASGHSTSPLMGRLGVDATMSSSTSSFDLDARITSIAWKPSTVAPLLAATNATTLSLWDLRSTPQGSVNSNTSSNTSNAPSTNSTTTQFKPTLRFGSAPRKGLTGARSAVSSFVQVACSPDSDEVATIDSIGTVRVYDIRMTERSTSSKNNHTSGSALAMFSAFDTAGVGISYFGTQPRNGTIPTSSTSSWLTWGLDNMTSPTVKIWSTNTTPVNTDDYWFMDGQSSGGNGVPSQRPPRQTDYQLVAQCSRPNLACARVCASPVEGSFMAIGHTATDEESGGWWADLYKLAPPDAERNLRSRTFGLEKIIGFTGGSPNADNEALSSVLGSGADLGELQASELAFSSVRSRDDVVTSGENEEDAGDMELLLCCLSDTGIVTTHVVPEAIPRSTTIKSADISTRRLEMPSTRPSRTMLRTGFSANQAKVYPEDREGTSLFDAAGFWGTDTQNNRSDDPFSEQAAVSSPQKKSVGGVDPLMPHSRRLAEGGVMPFDVEVPVAYGSVTAGNITGLQIGVNDIASGKVGTTTGMGVAEEGDNVAGDVRETNAMMENIETERVPCPRLCGATFGSGNGGLAIFHNGEVKKMWYWYQRADTVRLSGAPGVKGDAVFSDAESIELVIGTSGRTSHPPSQKVGKQKLAISSSGPRTLKELMSMTTSAKEAQWGERNGSDGSDSEDSLGAADDFFEDDSLDDSNSSDSGDDAPSTPPSDMYSRYFGQNWKGKPGRLDTPGSPSRGPNPESPASSRKIRTFVGPSSDMLAPLVRVTHAFDSMVLNHQSIYLAKEWELGGWDYNPSEALVDYQPSGHHRSGSLEEEKEGPKDEDLQAPTSPSRQNAGLPSYRFLVTPTRRNQMPRPRSDPNMIKANRPRNMKYNIEEERGVHGGEYAVRPNMEESMTFLRKLFTHQQEGGTAFPTLRSPPDSPLSNSLVKGANILSKGTKRALSTGQISTFPGAQPKLASNDLPGRRKAESNDIQVMPLGVYTLSLAITDDNKSDAEELEEIKRICLHNASVCEAFGSTEKAGVWNLLAETVDSQVKDNGKGFNGWGGNGGGALGVDLVSNLLRYYESLGDVQMLATMFCVLSGGHRSTRRPGRPYLLPQGQEEKYDAYIRRYAELLYGWGLLSLRAELNKHLLRISPRFEKNPSSGEKTGTERSPGLALVFVCPRCDRDADPDTNICRTCQDFAFRCSICDSAVRGLFTVCDTCNHGGHVEHIKSWFAKHDECPTGCGCNCTFTSYVPHTDIV